MERVAAYYEVACYARLKQNGGVSVERLAISQPLHRHSVKKRQATARRLGTYKVITKREMKQEL